MKKPLIIQGGMGAAVSGWCLAKAVSVAGQLGVVSGTALDLVMAMRLQAGDKCGSMRRALGEFPIKSIGQNIIDRFFDPKGVNAGKGMDFLPMSVPLKEKKEDDIVAANFAEVYLAKEGHDGIVGINFLEKIQIPNLASIYGSLLAGVDYIIMGAGIPREIPAIIEKLVNHEPVNCRLNIDGTSGDDDYRLSFDPSRYGLEHIKLKRPQFLAIVSSNILALTLMKKSVIKPDGIIIEYPTAGGHNAPPRVSGVFNNKGEPIYGEKDLVDIAKIRELNIPFWLAGSYGCRSKLKEALCMGATGIQVGTAFAFAKESGMSESLKKYILQNGTIAKTDPLASPTGFPFKVAQIAGTLSDDAVYNARKRRCNLGYLKQSYKCNDGSVGFRCPAEPVKAYVAKGGAIEETVGRKCVCAGLLSTVGLPIQNDDGSFEPAIVTMGDDVRFFSNVKYGYTAQNVVDYLMKYDEPDKFSVCEETSEIETPA